jgi:hypothetical protein
MNDKKLVNKRKDLIDDKHIQQAMKKTWDCATYTNRAI